MYKLLNLLFGWDYVYWTNGCDSGIARVREAPDNTIWFFRYRITNIIDKIKNPEDVTWLTCHPSKYFRDIQLS
jgi:hypothetical protein